MSIAVILLRVPVITLFFERGAFDFAATNQVTNAVIWYMVAFVPLSILAIFTYTFYSLRRLSAVVTLGILNVILTIASDIVFSHWWGYIGIAISTACVAGILVVVAWFLLARDQEPIIHFQTTRRMDVIWLSKLVLSAGIMTLAIILMQSLAFSASPGGVILLVNLLVISSLGAMIYIGAMFVLRNPEIWAIATRVSEWVAIRTGIRVFARKEP